ncbi:transglutaminase family protein [Actinomyces slackii]|uniref:Transglutaminase-like superfamily n=1 Tax=Actinomyces slackii TaxID=52774 RepID=A0A3S4SNY0_9ACTO|nr:transglutaminase-like domain-containing protein [Actinomyces slackii]VEG74482.1 Transglutaminase-like superfamily [Actinomyces slackii]
MDPHLRETRLLDLPAVEPLVRERRWRELAVSERIGAVYDFVRELPFGYNARDDLPASRVLADGYGQCNTKTILLMALLRAAGVPCRLHGATIHKSLQRGVVTGLAYRLAPDSIVHTWAEVRIGERWTGLEGVICDPAYLDGVRRLTGVTGEFLGFAVGTDSLADPPVNWCGTDTAIQQTGINRDFGTFDSPDDFYARHGINLSGIQSWVYQHLVRHLMNRRVARIRASHR